jgi:peptidyl-prolyl cis-trans isomerase NIMA-interacting 1
MRGTTPSAVRKGLVSFCALVGGCRAPSGLLVGRQAKSSRGYAVEVAVAAAASSAKGPSEIGVSPGHLTKPWSWLTGSSKGEIMRGTIPWFLTLTLVACGGAAPQTKHEVRLDSEEVAEIKCVEVAKTPRRARADAPARIDVAHIVIRHVGIRDAGSITRTRGEACLRAEEVRKKLLAGADWDEMYQTYSDSKDATKGAFSGVTQDALDDDFGNAAFALNVDELSHVVETKHGFHVIWRSK